MERILVSLYECALAVEKDAELRKEMAEWSITLTDGLNDDKEINFKLLKRK